MRKHAPPCTAWHRGIGAALATAIALSLYLRTGAPGLTWAHAGADGGDLITASMVWGVPHPSGYPTYILLSRLFAWAIEATPIARRFTLFSSLTGALSVGLTYLWIRQIVSRSDIHPWEASLVAFGSALCWGLAPALWQQAVITEVYTLQSCFAALCLLLTARITAQDQAAATWRWSLLGIVLGVGLGAHLTSVLLWPGLLLALWPQRRISRWAWLAGGACLGTGIYAYLPLAARMLPLVSWGDARSWSGFWWIISGRLYQGYLFGLPISALPGRLAAWAQMWREQLTVLGMLVAGAGLSALADSNRPWLRATLLTAALYSIYAIAYDTTDSHVYMLAALMMGALWLAQGAIWLAQAMEDRLPTSHPRAISLLSAALLVSLALWLGLQSHGQVDLSQDNQATRWLEQTCAQLPANAILVTGQDRHTFALDYQLWVEGRRQDIVVLDGELADEPWYRQQLATRYPTLEPIAANQGWEDWLVEQSGNHPLYLASPRPELDAWFTTQDVGQLTKLSLRKTPAAEPQ